MFGGAWTKRTQRKAKTSMGSIGLTADRVREMTRSMVADDYAPSEALEASDPRYRDGEAWHRNKEKMRINGALIFAMALRGYSQQQIAASFSVSNECVRKKLKPVGILRAKGRPKRGVVVILPAPCLRADTQSSYLVASPWRRDGC